MIQNKFTEEEIRAITRICELLCKFMSASDALIWLDTPHSELNNKLPSWFIDNGQFQVILSMLEAAYQGIPT